MERHHVGMTLQKGHSRGYPPWVHFFVHGKKVLARVGDWSKEQMNKVEQSGEATFMLARRDEIPRISRPRRQAVWQGVALWGARENHVLGRVFCDYGQAEDVAARI